MNSHDSHNNLEVGDDMEDKQICEICGEEIWANRWGDIPSKKMNKHVCLHCYMKLKSIGGSFRPRMNPETGLNICDCCGEPSETVQMTEEGWLCEDCIDQEC